MPLPPNASASRKANARVLPLLDMKSLLCKRWILERQPFPRLQPFGNQSFIAALARHLYGSFFEFRPPPHVGHGSACFPKKSVCGNHNSIGNASHGDANSRSHSRREPRIASCQAEFHRKISRHWPTRAEIQAGRGTDRVHMPVEAAIRKRI